MSDRYLETKIFKNDSDLYKNLLEARGLKSVTHYGKLRLNKINLDEIATLEKIAHIWGPSDKFYKIAHKYYGNSKFWWVIAWFNKKPMDSFVQPGEQIFVPLPLEEAVYYASREDE